jgi:membrane fusion protein (multidrug efflux system)
MKPRRVHHLLAGAALLSVPVALLPGCDGVRGEDAPAAAATDEPSAIVKYVEAWRSPIEVRVRAVGTTRAVDAVTVTSEVSARILSIDFRDEEVVDRGQVLARLDSSLARADLDAAKARMERLRLQHQRTLDAFRAGASNQSEVDNARTLLAEAEAEVERAERVVEDHTLRAPFEGRVGRRLESVGALVNPGDAIAELRSVDPMEIAFSAPEVYLSAMRVGARVQAESQAFPGRVFDGALKVTGSTVDAATRTVEVYATAGNADGALRPGMFLSVELVVGEKPDAVLIPESAVVREGARADVYVIRDGRAVRTRVELGERSPGVVEVVRGVDAGDRVVTQGLQRIRDGILVDASEDDELETLGVKVGAAMRDQPAWEGGLAGRHDAGGAQDEAQRRLAGAVRVDDAGAVRVDAEAGTTGAAGSGR